MLPADVNNDGTVNVLDIVSTVNLLWDYLLRMISNWRI